jgi:hypothetical protein
MIPPSVIAITSTLSLTAEASGVGTMESALLPEDPSYPIKGMYRLLDLTMEQGKNGIGNNLFVVVYITLIASHPTVDKIVIAQESLQEFINALSPGSYSSIKEVNFKKLDELLLKPIGVYGSKEEIVRFLRETGAVDVEMCVDS